MRMIKNLDEFKLKPFLIYKYQHDEMAMQAKYFEKAMKEGEKWEKGFV